MSFEDEQAKPLRRKIDYIEIDLDYCSNIYGTSPCTASESIKCYNTFFTCKDKSNFTKTTKTYKFINSELPASTKAAYYPARPLIKSVNELATELNDSNTTTRRLKIQLYDEPGNDVGIDPYRDSRIKIRGMFWKKFLARNPNYVDRYIRYYEGYEGLDIEDFEMRYTGKLDNISIDDGIVTIEAADLLKKMSEYDYPFAKDIYLAEDLPAIYEAESQDEMLELSASKGEFCRRTNFTSFLHDLSVPYESDNGSLSPEVTYTYWVVAYDEFSRDFAKSIPEDITFSDNILLTGTENTIDISWSEVTRAAGYRVYMYDSLTETTRVADVGDDTSYTVYYTTQGTETDFSNEAERYFKLTGSDSTDIDDWDEYNEDFTVEINDASELDSSGYFKCDDEIIYYGGIDSNTLTGIRRGQNDTDYDSHDEYTSIFLYKTYSSENPFSILKDLLEEIDVTSDYITSKFDEYEADWDGPSFGLVPLSSDTTLDKIFFQLVNAVDCMCWQNEDGKVDILKHSEMPETYEHLTDEANFIENSESIDDNQDSRYTDAVLYWNYSDTDKGIEDSDAYTQLNISTDADARSDYEYGDEVYDKQYCVWLNTDFDSTSTINTYVNSLLDSRRQRHRDAQVKLTEDLEIKDSSLRVGQIVLISTKAIQDIHGNNLSRVGFRIVKRTQKAKKLTVVFKRLYSATDTLQADTGEDILADDGSEILTKLFK